MDDHSSALIVIPTYNEADNLEPLIRQITALPTGFDILVVDDNSPDGTGEIADRLADELLSMHVLHRPGKQGLGTAYIAGFRWALEHGYDHILEMDCDFSHHPPAPVPRKKRSVPACSPVITSSCPSPFQSPTVGLV